MPKQKSTSTIVNNAIINILNNDIRKAFTLCYLVKLSDNCKIGFGRPSGFLKQHKFILTTVTKPAHWRFLQLIDVKGSAVFHSDVVLPVTAAA